MAGPPPHGKALGLAKCCNKYPTPNGKFRVVFEWVDDENSMFVRSMSAEDAKYWVEGTVYNILGTQP